MSVSIESRQHGLAIHYSHLVQAEIMAVTSAMRKNARWSNSSSYLYFRKNALADNMGLRRGSYEKPATENREADLMGGFDELKREIRQNQDVRQLQLPALLSPFLSLIRSPLSTGPITSTVLSSLHTFFVYGLITPSSCNVRAALSSLCTTLSHLRFEGTDPTGDEIVLFRMLVVSEACLTGEVGNLLGDVEVCELLETVLTLCCQMRRSDLLRRKAELTMHHLVRTVFSRLAILSPSDAEKGIEEDESQERIPVDARRAAIPSESLKSEPVESSTEQKTPQAMAPISTSLAPYGLLSIRELLRVVINLLDPTDPLHTDSIRLTALGILNSALEVSSIYLASFPSLCNIITDRGCKFLFQLACSENPQILYLSLRAITMIFQEDSMLKQLKLQQELFLSFTLDRLAPPFIPNGPNVHLSVGTKGHAAGASRSSLSSRHGTTSPEPSVTNGRSVSGDGPDDGDSSIDEIPAPLPRLGAQPARGETRELLLETLAHMARQPSFFANLWVNYDCDKNREDIFERLISYLTRSVYPSQYSSGLEAQRYTSHLLCLDLLLSYIHSMALHTDYTYPSDASLPTPDQLKSQKAYKKLFLAGTARFNTKPKLGLSFLQENGLLLKDEPDDVPRARSIAKFLKSATRLDKRLLGDFISRSENTEILKEFISLYDFKSKSIAEALRELLESFRLPGEAQQISRITETFASIYFATEPAEIKSEDAVYVLAYAVIMLNTDQHSPNIRKRMTAEDFQRNLRGVNFGSDFAPEYLLSIYDNIRKREIIMPEEHTGQAGFDYAWKELLLGTKTSGSLYLCDASIYDGSMFTMTWKSIVSSIASAFTIFDDEYVIQDVIAGFRECATLARRFQLPEVFDYIVMSISHATGLLSDSSTTLAANFPTVNIDGQTITVSTLSIRFGTSFRSQLAAVVLFTIANGNGNAIRDGWSQIFEMFQTLFLYSLLPTRMLQTEDFLGGVSMIPMQGNSASPLHNPNRPDGGLLSALSSYLLTPYSAGVEAAVPNVTERDIENTLSAIDCIGACRIDELYNEIMLLDLDALVAAVRALAELADRRTTSRLSELDELSIRLHEDGHRTLPYDPTSVFLLEMLVSITVQTASKIEEIWPLVFTHISGILASPTQFSILLVERAVVGLLRIALILATQTTLRDQLYIALDLLGGLALPIVNAVAEQLVSGVALIIRKHRGVISSATEWGLIFALLRPAVAHHEAGKLAFDVVSELAESLGREGDPRMEYLPALIVILEEFSSVPGRALELRVSRRPQPNVTATSPNLVRAVKAIELLYNLRIAVSLWIGQSTLPVDQAWKTGWTPLLIALGRQSADLSAEVRNAALNCLQRLLLGQQIASPGLNILHLFDRVLFPMVDDLLRTDLNNRALNGVSESRLRASTLLCKSFLHFQLGANSELNHNFRELWVIVLDLLSRLMHSSGRQSQLMEAVPESLKNVLLIMHSSDMLVPPSDPDVRDDQQQLLWNETNQRLARFLPGLLDELIPTPSRPLPPSLPEVSPGDTTELTQKHAEATLDTTP